jgi:anti-sigma factor RsiW
MNCKRCHEWLTAYVDDALEPGQRAQVQAHMNQCAACARQGQEQAQTRQLLRALPHGRTSPQFEARLAERLAQIKQPVPRSAWWTHLAPPPRLRPALALGTATFAIVGAVFLHPWTPAPTTAVPSDDYASLIAQSVALHERDVAAQPLAAPAASGVAASHSVWTADTDQGTL